MEPSGIEPLTSVKQRSPELRRIYLIESRPLKTEQSKDEMCISVIFLRKEVIQPHLPIRLPCYDFTPIIYPTLGGAPKGYLTDFGCYKLSWCDGRCVQGPGTYSPRRADPRLLAIPASCGELQQSELREALRDLHDLAV